MNISTKGRYAMRALAHVASSYYDGNKPVSIKAISEKERISSRYLENIFVALRKADILKSIKGEKGGFMLSKPPEKITVYEILKAVENKVSATPCTEDPKNCGRGTKCGMKKIWAGLNKAVADYLKSTTLKDAQEMHFESNER